MWSSTNARSVPRSSGTSLFFALLAVGADAASDQDAATVFSLSVNETLELFVVRDHPSGTFTSMRPPVDRYGTYWVLSGMSPGGLLSAGTGDSVGIGLWVRAGVRVPPGPGCVVPCADDDTGALLDDELHETATTTTAATRKRWSKQRCFISDSFGRLAREARGDLGQHRHRGPIRRGVFTCPLSRPAPAR